MDKWKNVKAALKRGVVNNKRYTLTPINVSVKLNQNESPFDLPGSIKDEILARLKDMRWNLYPDFVPTDLYNKIAKYYGVKFENILIGNGSNEMINTILTATVDSGTQVVIPTPTFTVYQLITSNLGGGVVPVALNEDLSFDVEAICRAAKIFGSVTVLCSPNNPTGTPLTQGDIIRVLESSQGIVVVDEAYIHFGGESVLSLVANYDNLIVLRTFSKAFGLAGLRMGMMFADEKMITEMAKVKLPYNMNIFSIITLDVIFDHTDIIEESVAYILEEKAKYEAALKQLAPNIEIVPSVTNFFLIKVKSSKKLFDYLLTKDILVRDVSSYPMLDNYLRITVGTREENDKLIGALIEYK